LIGEVRTFGFPFAPKGWATCDGRELAVNRYNVLLAVIGIEFGGTGSETFRLPDLRSRTPLGHGDCPGLGPAPIGSHPSDLARPDVGRHPRLHVTGCIAIDGEFPRRG
jgi:microcystin-dependent protein